MASVSVIIPVKNRVNLLEVTLNNILQQSLKPLEVLVVDDHSEEDIEGLINSKFACQVTYIKSKGKGPGAARNTGLMEASGNYIKFFDSDDLMTSNTLAEQVKKLEQSGKGFVYSPYFYAQLNGGQWEQIEDALLNYYPWNTKYSLTQWMCRGLFITIPGMLFTRELLNEVGPWREDIVAYEDFDYLFRISILEPQPAHTNKCAFLYRLHGNQTVGQKFSNENRDSDKLKMLDDLMSNNLLANLSALDVLHFQNLMFETLSVYRKDHAFSLKYNNIFGPIAFFWYWYKKVLNKWGRMKTKCGWQPEHGPFISNNQFNYYLRLIFVKDENSITLKKT